MKSCPKCNTQIPEECDICPNCEKESETAVSPAVEESTSVPEEENLSSPKSDSTPPKKSNKLKIIIPLVIVIVATTLLLTKYIFLPQETAAPNIVPKETDIEIPKDTEIESTSSPVDSNQSNSGNTEDEKSRFSADAKPVDGKEYIGNGLTYIIYNDDSIEIVNYEGNQTSITIPSEIDDHPVSRIGASAFENCTFIEDIYLYADVISIGDCAFKNCTSLEDFTIPKSMKSIGVSAFEGCSNMTDVFVYGGETIGDCAFKNCTSLEDFTIPKGMKSIGVSAFEGCTNLEDVYVYSDDVTYSVNVFANCPKLEELPDGAYPDGVFSDDSSNTSQDNESTNDDSEIGVVKHIHSAADIPNKLMNDKFKSVIDLFSKGYSQSGLNISNAIPSDDGKTYIFYLDNLEFLGKECEDGALQPRIIYSGDAINNNGAPDKIFFEIANPLKSNGYKETVKVVEDIAEALGISDWGLIDNDYSSSSAWATGEYATFSFTNLKLELTVSNTDGTVEIEITPIG